MPIQALRAKNTSCTARRRAWERSGLARRTSFLRMGAGAGAKMGAICSTSNLRLNCRKLQRCDSSHRARRDGAFLPGRVEVSAFRGGQGRRIGAWLVFEAVIIEVAIEFLAHGGPAPVEAGLDHVDAQVEDLGGL